MEMEQIITRGMRHARQGETGHFSHRLPVCSSSNQAFRSPFSHLGYGWILLDGKLVSKVLCCKRLCFLNLHILPYVFYDLASNNIPTKVVVQCHPKLRQMLSHPMATLSVTQTTNSMLFASRGLEPRQGWQVGFDKKILHLDAVWWCYFVNPAWFVFVVFPLDVWFFGNQHVQTWSKQNINRMFGGEKKNLKP